MLVLVPGGAFVMGAQSEDPARPNFDAAAREFDGPPHQFDLDPFFISKYEMSQGQWARFAGTNPSYQSPNAPTWRRIEGTDLLHPVEAVNWKDCVKTLGRMGLALPTEAQWEYAARAGTNSVWWTGTDRNSLLGAVNLADRSGFVNGQSATWPSIDDWPELRDGYLGHAPVDSMRPNPYGLHHVHGNVFEWCSTPYADYSESPRAGDGERDGDESMRMMRGGSFGSTAGGARVAHRAPTPPDSDSNAVGLRPAKALSR